MGVTSVLLPPYSTPFMIEDVKEPLQKGRPDEVAQEEHGHRLIYQRLLDCFDHCSNESCQVDAETFTSYY